VFIRSLCGCSLSLRSELNGDSFFVPLQYYSTVVNLRKGAVAGCPHALESAYVSVIHTWCKCKCRKWRRRQDAQLSQRDRNAGNISFGRKWKT